VKIGLATALVVGSMMMLPRPAAADALEAANRERMRGCGVAVGRMPLQSNSKLQQAAKRYADGASLQGAVAAAGYLAAQSSAIHLTGPMSDAEIERMLGEHYCGTLQDPQLRDFGAERRGRDLWMVLGTPVALGAPGDEASVNRRILSLVNEARAAGRRCGGKYFAPVGPLALRSSTRGIWPRTIYSIIAGTMAARRGCGWIAPASAITVSWARILRPAR
jgi:hypothetical protein